MERLVYTIMTDQKAGFLGMFLKPVFLILSWMYMLGLKCVQLFYKFKILPVNKLPRPVICVGNITVGGSGKTPMVIALAQYFQNKGLRPVILTRGYMPESSKQTQSDEVLMIKEILKDVPVCVGKDRFKEASIFLKSDDCDVFIMDDGFQHLKLHRDINICLVNGSNPFGNDYLLPRGILREPKKALKRADYVVITKASKDGFSVKEVEQKILDINSDAEIVHSQYILRNFSNLLSTDQKHPISYLKDKNVCLLSSIGDPEFFERSVVKLGAKVIRHFSFRDHHVVSEHEFSSIKAFLKENNINIIITTHKDGVKLKQIFTSDLRFLEILILNIEVEFIEQPNILFERLDKMLHTEGQ